MLQADNDDKELTTMAMAETGIPVKIEFLDSIKELDGLVSKEGNPALILLNERKDNGMMILQQLRSSSDYGHIPVVLLMEDLPGSYVQEYYRAGANTLVKKPSTVHATGKKITAFFKYWLEVAELSN
jgi:CheY-like chemotaxis protein